MNEGGGGRDYIDFIEDIVSMASIVSIVSIVSIDSIVSMSSIVSISLFSGSKIVKVFVKGRKKRRKKFNQLHKYCIFTASCQ